MTAAEVSSNLRRLPWPPPSSALKTLREVLGRGGVLAIPTESSYALAADPRNQRGVAAVYTLKGRGWNKPLPVAVASMAQLELLGVVAPAEARKALEALWPSRLTAVLPLALSRAPSRAPFRALFRDQAVPAAAGGSTLAVRVPEHPELCRLLEQLGPLTVTSANRSGEGPALTAEEAGRVLCGEDADLEDTVLDDTLFGDTILLDAGTLPGGPPSTLVLWKGKDLGEIGPWDVLRRGAFDPQLLAPEEE